MKRMKSNTILGNDGSTKEFHETFWDELKFSLMESINRVFYTKILSISQMQAVIKLTEKKYRHKRYIKNWRRLSLLNVETKSCLELFQKK